MRTLRAELEDARTQLREQLTQNGAYKADLDAAEKRLITVKNLLKVFTYLSFLLKLSF